MKFHQYLETGFLNIQFAVVLILLLLEAGGIESNPGPNPENTLSVLHLNIRSIRNKMDYLRDNFTDFEVACFSETHLDMAISSDALSISNSFSNLYRKDRNMHGGGLLMYINTNLAHRRRQDLEFFAMNQYGLKLK